MALSPILPANLVKLKLMDSVLKDEDPMRALGELFHLKILILSNVFDGTELVCKHGSFPQLEELYLDNLMYFQTWKIEDGAMPCLKKLDIRRCLCLKKFPQSLEFVKTLQQFDFYGLGALFIKEALKYGWSPPKLRLPSNFGAIICRADSPVDASSIRLLYVLLTAGVFLDNKKQKYWVVEHDNSYHNCFMVYASNLFSSYFRVHKDKMRIKEFADREEETMSVIELLSPFVCLNGIFSTADLSSPMTYEIIWVVMVTDAVAFCRVDELENRNINVCTEISCQDSNVSVKEFVLTDENISEHWIYIQGGEFKTNPSNKQEIHVSMYYVAAHSNSCGGTDPTFSLTVKGFIVQPKILVSRDDFLNPPPVHFLPPMTYFVPI